MNMNLVFSNGILMTLNMTTPGAKGESIESVSLNHDTGMLTVVLTNGTSVDVGNVETIVAAVEAKNTAIAQAVIATNKATEAGGYATTAATKATDASNSAAAAALSETNSANSASTAAALAAANAVAEVQDALNASVTAAATSASIAQSAAEALTAIGLSVVEGKLCMTFEE